MVLLLPLLLLLSVSHKASARGRKQMQETIGLWMCKCALGPEIVSTIVKIIIFCGQTITMPLNSLATVCMIKHKMQYIASFSHITFQKSPKSVQELEVIHISTGTTNRTSDRIERKKQQRQKYRINNILLLQMPLHEMTNNNNNECLCSTIVKCVHCTATKPKCIATVASKTKPSTTHTTNSRERAKKKLLWEISK